MKTYTDLEQSKKLAEVLPTESADMFCADVFDKEKETHSYNFHILSTWGCNTFDELKDRENKFVSFIPAWSLTALLSIIKNRPDCNKVEFFSNNASKWALTTTYYDSVWKEKEIVAEDPIDAAFEMVCWLLKT